MDQLSLSMLVSKKKFMVFADLSLMDTSTNNEWLCTVGAAIKRETQTGNLVRSRRWIPPRNYVYAT